MPDCFYRAYYIISVGETHRAVSNTFVPHGLTVANYHEDTRARADLDMCLETIRCIVSTDPEDHGLCAAAAHRSGAVRRCNQLKGVERISSSHDVADEVEKGFDHMSTGKFS